MRTGFFSLCYRIARYTITFTVYFFQYLFARPKDLETAVACGDKALSSLRLCAPLFFDFNIPKGIETEVYGMKFPSPIVGASFKSELQILDIWFRMGLGGIILKTIMQEERDGNLRPRLQDAFFDGQKGLLNSMGLPGPGIDEFAIAIPKFSIWDYGRPLGISVGGDSREDYVDTVATLEQALCEKDSVYFYELNISCPNTETGKSLSDNLQDLELVLQEVRQLTSNPVSVKVSPDQDDGDLKKIGEISKSIHKVIINAGNTTYKKSGDVGIASSHFSSVGGGLSGPVLFYRTLNMVKLFSDFNIPIMATGGISTINHVAALQEAGATLFGMATALVFDPYCIPKINRNL